MRTEFLFPPRLFCVSGRLLGGSSFQSEGNVKTHSIWLVVLAVMLAVLLVVVGAPSPAAERDVVSVDLKTFKFKVRPEMADLFGYNDGEDKLFYYAGGSGETTVKLPADGEYEIVIRASCDPARMPR